MNMGNYLTGYSMETRILSGTNKVSGRSKALRLAAQNWLNANPANHALIIDTVGYFTVEQFAGDAARVRVQHQPTHPFKLLSMRSASIRWAKRHHALILVDIPELVSVLNMDKKYRPIKDATQADRIKSVHEWAARVGSGTGCTVVGTFQGFPLSSPNQETLK